jgi:uncharacterized protein
VTLFLATFFLLYGGIHCYVFLKTRAAVPLGLTGSLALVAVMALMVLASVIVRFLEKGGLESLARIVAYSGYLWMGAIFIFFSASILIDLYRFILFSVDVLGKFDLSRFYSAHGYFFAVSLGASLFVVTYGYFEARHIGTERVVVSSPKIPAEVGTVRIVQISDVHLGLIVRGERLDRILRKVKDAEPDLLVMTGDLVDGDVDGLRVLAEPLAAIKPRYGKFAITGNHEYYAGIKNSLAFIQKAGFVMLRGEGRNVGALINIAGVDDISGKRYPSYVEVNEKMLLLSLPNGFFTVLLKHRPVVDSGAVGYFDIQLSGHVHQGQIFPFRLVTRLFFSYVGGSYPLREGSLLHVSRGSGTWGPPVRFLAPPEVTIIELKHQP